MALLQGAKEYGAGDDDELIFANMKGKPLSDMTLSKIMRDAQLPFTVHGFRSSFRDWAAEKMSHIPDAVAEAALAHTVADKVVAAYKRTDFHDMRQTLLDAWGQYLSGDPDSHLPGGNTEDVGAGPAPRMEVA